MACRPRVIDCAWRRRHSPPPFRPIFGIVDGLHGTRDRCGRRRGGCDFHLGENAGKATLDAGRHVTYQKPSVWSA